MATLSNNSISPSDKIFRENRESMGIDCPICENTGFLHRKDERGCILIRECECMVVYRNKLRLKRSGLVKVIDAYTFDKYKTAYSWQKSIKEIALKFLEQSEKWFYIGGSVGCGKSHICTAICREVIERHEVYYMPWRDEIVQIKANTTNDEEYRNLINPLKIVPVLYIDDFLKGKYTDADLNVAFEILNYRYVNRQTTLISSEKTIDDIIDIDEAIGSRIYQMAGEFEITVKGAEKNIRLSGVGA